MKAWHCLLLALLIVFVLNIESTTFCYVRFCWQVEKSRRGSYSTGPSTRHTAVQLHSILWRTAVDIVYWIYYSVWRNCDMLKTSLSQTSRTWFGIIKFKLLLCNNHRYRGSSYSVVYLFPNTNISHKHCNTVHCHHHFWWHQQYRSAQFEDRTCCCGCVGLGWYVRD
jgi:hypothetical protein